MEDWQKKGPLGIVADIANKTIGFDIAKIQPMSEEEATEFNKKLKAEREEWEKQHPDILESWHKHEMKSASKRPYELTSKERERVKEILKMNDDVLNTCDITIMEDGDISVSTCKSSWMALAGREWWINLKTKECRCVALS